MTVWLVRMAYRAPDPDTGGRMVACARQLEVDNLEEGRRLTRAWAARLRTMRPPPVDALVILETRENGSTVAAEELSPWFRPPVRPGTAEEHLSRAREALAAARPAGLDLGGFTP